MSRRKTPLLSIPSLAEMQQGGVYKFTNSINDFTYIGSCKKFSDRLAGHICDSKRGKANRYLIEFVNDFGWETISFEILEVVEDFSLLKTRENHWIGLFDFNLLWNCAPKADTLVGTKMPLTHKIKSSERMKGNTLSVGYVHSKEKGIKCAKYWEEHPKEKEEMISKNKESQSKVDRSSWEKGKIIEVYYEKVLIDTVEGLKNVETKYNLGHTYASKMLQGKKPPLRGYFLKTIGSYFISDKVYIRRYLNGKEIIENKL